MQASAHISGPLLHLHGPLTMLTSGALLKQLQQQWNPTITTVDLSGLTEVDSAAVSLLLAIKRRSTLPLTLSGASPSLLHLVEMYGVTGLLFAQTP